MNTIPVMRGLDPRIPIFKARSKMSGIAGTSPAMTRSVYV
jgi:hypothetical protein